MPPARLSTMSTSKSFSKDPIYYHPYAFKLAALGSSSTKKKFSAKTGSPQGSLILSKEAWEPLELGTIQMHWSESSDPLESKTQEKHRSLSSESGEKNGIQSFLDETPPLAIKTHKATKLHPHHSQHRRISKAVPPSRTNLIHKSNNKATSSAKSNATIQIPTHTDHPTTSDHKKPSNKPNLHSKKPSLPSGQISHPTTIPSISPSPQSSTLATTPPSSTSSTRNHKRYSSTAAYSLRPRPSPSPSPCPIFEMWQSALGKAYCPEGNACRDMHMIDGEFFYFGAEYDGEVDVDVDLEEGEGIAGDDVCY